MISMELSVNFIDQSDNSINEIIGGRIRILRKRSFLDITTAARMLNISAPALSKIENGITDLSISRMEQIARLYHINVSQLFSPDFFNEQSDPQDEDLLWKRIADKDVEIGHLLKLIIELYEELHAVS
jgi:transcriptional regulator with XRE-family HTH domain